MTMNGEIKVKGASREVINSGKLVCYGVACLKSQERAPLLLSSPENRKEIDPSKMSL